MAIAIDPRSHDICVVDSDTKKGEHKIVLFRPGSNGDASPKRTIKLPLDERSMIGGIALDRSSNIYVALNAIWAETSALVLVFAKEASKPRAIIGGDSTGMNEITGIAIGPYPVHTSKTRPDISRPKVQSPDGHR